MGCLPASHPELAWGLCAKVVGSGDFHFCRFLPLSSRLGRLDSRKTDSSIQCVTRTSVASVYPCFVMEDSILVSQDCWLV